MLHTQTPSVPKYFKVIQSKLLKLYLFASSCFFKSGGWPSKTYLPYSLQASASKNLLWITKINHWNCGICMAFKKEGRKLHWLYSGLEQSYCPVEHPLQVTTKYQYNKCHERERERGPSDWDEPVETANQNSVWISLKRQNHLVTSPASLVRVSIPVLPTTI